MTNKEQHVSTHVCGWMRSAVSRDSHTSHNKYDLPVGQSLTNSTICSRSCGTGTSPISFIDALLDATRQDQIKMVSERSAWLSKPEEQKRGNNDDPKRRAATFERSMRDNCEPSVEKKLEHESWHTKTACSQWDDKHTMRAKAP